MKVAAFGASAVLAMRIFSEPPRGRLRRNHFIEQVIDEATVGDLDPREVVAGRVVITLPIERDAAPRRLGTQIGLN